MDNFPSRHGVRIGIEVETATDIDDVESDEEDDYMMDLDENESNMVSTPLGELQQLLLDKKNLRVIRHLTDLSDDRGIKHQRALSQATRPLYLAVTRVLNIGLPDRRSKLQMHDAILNSV
jgi:hypothetical protein